MLKLARLTDYATSVLVVLSHHRSECLSAAELSRFAHLELPTVSKVLKLLARAGLVDSFRGAHGGYQLAVDAGQISVAQIVRAIEGPIAMTTCTVEANSCKQEDVCDMRSNWKKVDKVVSEALESVSLADMRTEEKTNDDLRVRLVTA